MSQCFLKESLIHSVPCLCVSALSSRRPTILSTKRDGAFWLLRLRFVSEEYSTFTQIQGTSFHQRFLKFSPKIFVFSIFCHRIY